MTTANIIKSILEGNQDDDFNRIMDAVYARRNAVARSKVFSYSRGDRVRFNRGASPQYLIGLEGVVQKVNRTTVAVKIEGHAGRYTGQCPSCPVDIVDLIEKAA